MKKSLWTACFTSSIGWGGDGIIMIDGNQICGADENFYYHGAYSINASNIATAQIHVKSYGTSPHSILPGINEYTTCFFRPIRRGKNGFDFRNRRTSPCNSIRQADKNSRPIKNLIIIDATSPAKLAGQLQKTQRLSAGHASHQLL